MWLLLIIVGVLVWAIFAYNALVKHRNLVQEAWSGIDVQLKLRSDLLPSLVECVKAYKNFEASTLTEVTQLRSQVQHSGTAKARQDLENQISVGLGKIMVLSEDYPELQAGKNFQQLQRELVVIENQIQYARRYYNGTVRDYNICGQSFPNIWIAKMFNFAQKDFFEVISMVERSNVDVAL